VISDFLRSRARSFGYAFEGCKYVIRTQRNAWIHAVATILVFLATIWLRLSAHDVAILALVIGMVWMAEFFNTSIETIIDLTCPEIHPMAKIGKDVAAGAVLVAAIASVVVGLLIMGPPLLKKLNF
jgi:diacylglycerol kinase